MKNLLGQDICGRIILYHRAHENCAEPSIALHNILKDLFPGRKIEQHRNIQNTSEGLAPITIYCLLFEYPKDDLQAAKELLAEQGYNLEIYNDDEENNA